MGIPELEAEVKRLSPPDLATFSKWFENFAANSASRAGSLHADFTFWPGTTPNALRCPNRAEHSAWSDFSAQGLGRAYSESEPEYTRADVKTQ